MSMIVDNGDVNGDYCYMNSSNGYFIDNQNLIDYINKIDDFSTNIYLKKNNGLPDVVDIDDMSPASALNQYCNMEYNNVYHNFQSNGNIYTSKRSSVSTLTSPSVTSTNYKGCSLFIPIHKQIKYSDLSKTQSRAVRRASYVMNSHIKLVANKTWYYVILEYFLKFKDMKEVVSEMDIIIDSSTQEIIRQNKCQMRFLVKLVSIFKYQILVTNVINWSMF